MIAVKPAVYDNHHTMLRLYEIYCSDASLPTYWGDDDDSDSEIEISEPDQVSEIDCDDGFWSRFRCCQVIFSGYVIRSEFSF